MQCYQNCKSIDELLIGFEKFSRADFFDCLFFSDIVRAGSVLDRVARAVVMRVKRSLEEKYAEDLILSEIPKPPKSPIKKPSKSAKKKAKSPKNTTDSAIPASPATLPVMEDPKPWIRDLILALLERLPGEKEAVDDSSFQLVENTRRKTKNVPISQIAKPHEKGKKKNKSGKQTHKYSKSEVKGNSKAAISPNHAPLAIIVVHNAVQQSLLAPEIVAAEFPPLTKAVVSQPFPRLTEELQAFELCNSLVVEQQTYTRMRLMERLRDIVVVLFPGAEAQLFGSYSTGLALPMSDMDVAVRNTSFHFREEVQAAVKSLNNFLLFQPWTLSTKAISTATVPLVKLEVDPGYFSGNEAGPIKVDLTFEAQRSGNEHIGMASAEFVRRWVKQHPEAKSVALVLKQMMQGNDLNSAYLGGVSSYALIIWLVAYLRKEALADSGALLMAFLKFYAEDFNPKTTGIDLLKPE
jgi:predicted nucleotidyltransferase